MKYKWKNLFRKYGLYMTAAVVSIIAVISQTDVFNFRGEKSGDNGKNEQINAVERPDINEEQERKEIEVYLDGDEEPYHIEFDVSAQEYSKEQIEQVFDSVYDKIKVQMLGDNESLEKVSRNLQFVSSVEDYPVTIEWYSKNHELVDYDGTVYNSSFENDTREDVEIVVVMRYMNYSSQYSIDITVCKNSNPTRQENENWIKEKLKNADNSNPEDKILELPEVIGEKRATYSYQKEDKAQYLIILAAAAGVALYFRKYETKRKNDKLRREQLSYDYSEVVSKIVLLAGAGMSIRKAWERIVMDCKDGKEPGRYVYEEMEKTYLEINSGVPERVAYERFGKRCDTREYLKLGSLLAQNVKKGSKDLTSLLEKESENAFVEHKLLVKRRGEEAGTKLLIPMIMMLAVVMIIVMFPAMTSFGM